MSQRPLDIFHLRNYARRQKNMEHAFACCSCVVSHFPFRVVFQQVGHRKIMFNVKRVKNYLSLSSKLSITIIIYLDPSIFWNIKHTPEWKITNEFNFFFYISVFFCKTVAHNMFDSCANSFQVVWFKMFVKQN